MTPENGNALTVAMTVIDGGYELELETVDQSFAYRVRAVDQTDYDQEVLGRHSGRLVLTSRSYALRSDDAVQRVALG